MPSLFVIFNGQKVPVKQGRVRDRARLQDRRSADQGRQTSRAATRQSCCRTAAFYMKDLGSTNGIEFNGERVDVAPHRRGRRLPALRLRAASFTYQP
jgi:hypothetical protein